MPNTLQLAAKGAAAIGVYREPAITIIDRLAQVIPTLSNENRYEPVELLRDGKTMFFQHTRQKSGYGNSRA